MHENRINMHGNIFFTFLPRFSILIYRGAFKVWGVNANYEIFYRDGIQDDDPKGDNWRNIKGGLKQLDSGPKGIVCGVNYKSSVYCRGGITEENPAGTKWLYESGRLEYISCCDFGCWGVNKYNDVFFANQMNGRSTRLLILILNAFSLTNSAVKSTISEKLETLCFSFCIFHINDSIMI